MSMPRRAMKELGLQACCLRCDEEDVTGSQRCKGCISHHRNVRELIASAAAEDELFQFAKELVAMAASPHRHDHDEIHGEVLLEQQRLAAALITATPLPTSEEVGDLFAAQRNSEKSNIIRDVANQNPWKDDAPEVDVATQIGQEAWSDAEAEASIAHHGARTIPSKPITKVDRSDRVGEDLELSDRIHAAADAKNVAKELVDDVEAIGFETRQRARKELKDAISNLDEILDEDLDF
ncbi:MAG: hypothetical protein OSB30_04790 [Candidatus Poseidoniaceae archaeon]|nr:hypothetical protein [Candidatus Poseidoniaceae archaeon]